MASPKNPAAAARLLRQYLAERAEQGVDHAWLSEPALEQLGGLAHKTRSATARSKEVPTRTEEHPAGANRVAEPATPLANASEPAPGGDKAARLAQIEAEAESSERCRSQGTLRDTMVFAVGNPDADLMFVGEAPGAEEERQREPFVGPAGNLLTKIIQTMGLRREDVYISNIVKFRPSTGDHNQGTANRAPTPEEMAASVDFVLREIEVVEPVVIVALGGTAMSGLLGLDGSVGRARGEVHDLNGRDALVTYHPSYLLRSGSNTEKRKVWEDMLHAMELLGLPISDKQRGYFST